ncbi:unnamed protein product [Paramecium sonneborni]|uniref:Transmembrane protein n=1 Tax=Paramecium sonneborni TaxID=65129 RepID=A0A8S1R1I7_9CILI|nr:unnamed protein product [Paramecium sonneborni]
MIRINLVCFLYFEAFISFQLIWTIINTKNSLLWIPIVLHYVGIIFKLALIKYSDFKALWIAVVGNDGVALGLLYGEEKDLSFLYVFLLIQFELLYDTKMFYKQSLMVLFWGMIFQIICNYSEVWRLIFTLGECLVSLGFLYLINRKKKKTNNTKQKQSVQLETAVSAKQQILKLMYE